MSKPRSETSLPPFLERRASVRPAARSRPRVILALLGLIGCVAAIGVIDYQTGPEIGFSLFYLIPVVAAAWLYGRRASLLIALMAAASWFVADYLIRVSLGLSLWNGLTRLIIYVSQGWLIAMLRDDRRREAILARTDPITDLANSRAFLELLDRSVEEKSDLCVIYLDLDNFKRINDTHGHHHGDDVLRRTAAALRSTIRAGDVAARVGGDEFALVVATGDAEGAARMCERLVDCVGRISADYPGLGFGATAGCAVSHGRSSSDELLRTADDAMYEAKGSGKGTFIVRTLP